MEGVLERAFSTAPLASSPNSSMPPAPVPPGGCSYPHPLADISSSQSLFDQEQPPPAPQQRSEQRDWSDLRGHSHHHQASFLTPLEHNDIAPARYPSYIGAPGSNDTSYYTGLPGIGSDATGQLMSTTAASGSLPVATENPSCSRAGGAGSNRMFLQHRSYSFSPTDHSHQQSTNAFSATDGAIPYAVRPEQGPVNDPAALEPSQLMARTRVAAASSDSWPVRPTEQDGGCFSATRLIQNSYGGYFTARKSAHNR